MPRRVILRSMPKGTPSAPVTDLGMRLRDERVEAGLTQADLAEILGTQPNRISDWELGRHVPTLPLLERIAGVYDITVSRLLRGVM
jgi:transcriptional regulator with XRE-family HTH domain